MKYGKLNNDTIEYAGTVIRLDDGTMIVHPKKEHLLAAHYLPVYDDPPAVDKNHYAVPTGWKKMDDMILRTYEIRKLPTLPRHWSSLAMKRALEKAGRWAEIKALLSAADKYDDFIMADYIAEDDQDFKDARAQAVEMYGEEAVARLLNNIPEAT